MTAASGVKTQEKPASLPDVSTPSRKNFTVADDLVLLRCVNLVRPWEAAVGTTNGIMKAFEVVADKCRVVDGFLKKDGPALRTRFDRLVRTFREAQRASLRSSGSTEEYKERDCLLQDIVCRMDNWKELTEEERSRRRAKTEGIESSGELMRRLAMDELEDEALSENEGDGEHEASEVSETSESSEGVQPSCNQEQQHYAGLKRKGKLATRPQRAQKTSKREKLSAVTDGIALAIERSLGDDTSKYTYLRERLEFEREDSARKLAFEEKRMIAERERDERREEAEQERARTNQEFMLKLLQIAMGKRE